MTFQQFHSSVKIGDLFVLKKGISGFFNPDACNLDFPIIIRVMTINKIPKPELIVYHVEDKLPQHLNSYLFSRIKLLPLHNKEVYNILYEKTIKG